MKEQMAYSYIQWASSLKKKSHAVINEKIAALNNEH